MINDFVNLNEIKLNLNKNDGFNQPEDLNQSKYEYRESNIGVRNSQIEV